MLRALAVLLCPLFLWPPCLAAQQPSASQSSPPLGLSAAGPSGLLRGSSPLTLDPWHFGLGFSLVNYDRNPGDTDFTEYAVEGALGLPAQLEVFSRFTPLFEANSVNLDPVGFPAPPLDLVIDTFPSQASAAPPYFVYAQGAPYRTYIVEDVRIDPPGVGAYSESTGDVVLGVKWNLLSEQRGNRFGLGVQGYVEIPTEQPGYKIWSRSPFVPGVAPPTIDWQKKVGTSGKTDVGFDVLFSKQIQQAQLLVNVGYKHVGDPEAGYQVYLVNSGAITPQDFVVAPPRQFRLDLRDQLLFVADASVPVVKVGKTRFWGVGEFFHKRYVGDGTPVQGLVNPYESVFGAQADPLVFPWLALGAAWLHQWDSAGNGGQRVSPFGGNINFSEVVDPTLAAQVKGYLVSQGLPVLENMNGVFVTNNAAFDAWRNIPLQPGPVVSRGHGAFFVFLNIRR